MGVVLLNMCLGDVAREIMIQSGLAASILTQVWYAVRFDRVSLLMPVVGILQTRIAMAV